MLFAYQRQMNERAVEIDRRVQLRSQRVETSLRVLRQQPPGGAWIEELPGKLLLPAELCLVDLRFSFLKFIHSG
jgi:hypothetical protein